MTGKDDDFSQAAGAIPGFSNRKSKNNTFTINADYRDPFLGNAATFYSFSNGSAFENQQKNDISLKKEKQGAPTELHVKHVIWPKIEYSGLIVNNKNKKITGLLKIGNNEYLVSEGSIHDNIFIKHIYKDSINVSYQNQSKTLKCN